MTKGPRTKPSANRTVTPATSTPAPTVSAAARVDQSLVAAAYRKLANGQDLSRREREALKRFEKEKEEKLRWQYYRAIPQKHWRAMSGRQTKVLNEQAARYGLPVGGPFIDLQALARALHDFLAENALKLNREDDELMQGPPGSPALERYREERALLARLDRQEREGHLLPRDEAREALGRIAAILRGAGDALQRQFGPAAVEVLYEALDDAQREIAQSFGDDDHDEQPDAAPDADETTSLDP